MDERDPRRRFSRTVGDYRRYRPSYPESLMDWVVAHVPKGAVAVDVGAGTGIFSRQLARRGLEVIGVEPNAEMRAAAVEEGGVRYLAGEASATTLAPASASLVIAAQAFHWFPLEATLAEWQRIVRPDGWCGVVFNLRQPTPFAGAYQELLDGIPEYRNAARGSEALAALEKVIPALDGFEVPHLQPLDREGFLGRAFSASYVAHAGDPALRSALEALFDRFSDGGRVVFEYRALARLWRF